MQEPELSFDEQVKASVESGIKPLELQFVSILDCSEGYPFAYRTKTVVHSISMGNLNEIDYTYVTDNRDCGIELLKHTVKYVNNAIKQLEKKDFPVMFMSVRCPHEFVERTDLYTVMNEVLAQNPTLDPSQLCLEFPASLLEADKEKTATALKDMKLLKVKTAIVGCGSEEFPIAKLLTVTPDYVILDQTATAWAGDRNKPQLLSSLISYIKSMGIEVICEGDKTYYNSVKRTDCIGFIPKENETLTMQQVLSQQKEEQ